MTFFLITVATLVSEDLACVGAGALVAQGRISLVSAVLACMAGILIGDVFLWFLGRSVGRPALRLPVIRWMVSTDSVRRAEDWFHQRGLRVLFACRFVPGTRLPMYFAAGLLGCRLAPFTVCLLLAGAVWVPLVVIASSWAKWAPLVVVGLWLASRLCTWRGRRLLLSRWRRWTRWEFWPLWFFYLPVIAYIVWLAVKHRSLALFTAANPGIPAGGLVGESKSEILAKLPAEFVARYEVVTEPPAFFPAVLKPDAGQRGLGVAVVRSRTEAEEYFQVKRGPTIAQEYVPGFEFGVFYYRYPNAARGHIYSITEKSFPTVTGDGRSRLEELILRDDRAVCMARFFLKKHADRLDRVPAAGEVVPLAELGTHRRGSVFRDGGWVKTPELEAVIDRISRSFDGFFVGRYDIRTPSVEDFKRGGNFKIIELNGVTSEATHIYQPGASLVAGYRTLMRQWRITFEIAAQNRASGRAPLTLREVAQLIGRYQSPNEA
jgi:membrane protein DedA with SNARE-associated domain